VAGIEAGLASRHVELDVLEAARERLQFALAFDHTLVVGSR
jgi:hypothetical protein